jgi:CheY-like chemotaxis protein
LAGAQQTIDYLRVTADKPFLIICELSLPGSSGLELRQQIEDDAALRKRAIPFIFMTHPVYRQQVEAAYNLTIQGLFEKQPNIDATQKQLGSIIQYWQECLHPNRFADSE